MKKATGRKGKEVDVHVIGKMPKGPRGVISAYIAPNARPCEQQAQLTQEPYGAFNPRGGLNPP